MSAPLWKFKRLRSHLKPEDMPPLPHDPECECPRCLRDRSVEEPLENTKQVRQMGALVRKLLVADAAIRGHSKAKPEWQHIFQNTLRELRELSDASWPWMARLPK